MDDLAKDNGLHGLTAKPGLGAAGWLTGLAALLLLLGSFGQVAYRYTLPTDGWAVLSDEAVGGSWLLFVNLVGAESGLQPDDVLLAVDGVDVSGAAAEIYIPAPAGWQKGRAVTMTVQRGAVTLSMPVPVVGWTLAAFWRYTVSDPTQLSSLAGALLFLTLGCFTFWRRPEVPSARALLLLSTAEGVAFISGVLPSGLSAQFDRPALYMVGFFSYMIFGTVLAPALLTFTLLFPQPRRAIRRRPWLALLPHAYGLLLLLLLVAGAPGEIGWFSTLGMLAFSLAALGQGWLTQRDPVSRAQLRWASGGLASGVALFMLNFPLAFNWVTEPLLINVLNMAQSFAFGVIGSSLAIAVLRYRLFDIDVIIRKALQYAVLTVMLVLVYFGSVVLLQTLFERVFGQDSPLLIVLSTLLSALLFNPLRRQVQTLIDRRFFRQKYDAQQVLAAFAASARDEVELEALTGAMAHAVQVTMQPAAVSIWVRWTGGKQGQ